MKGPTYTPTLNPDMVERTKNVVMRYFTLDELYNRNLHGCVSYGIHKRQLDTDKVETIRREVSTYCPCLPSEEKKAWAECVRVVDKANVYLLSVIRRKFDISPIIDYL